MPCLQVVQRHCFHRRVFGLPRIRTICSVDQLRGFAPGNLAWVVVPPRDGSGHIALGVLQLPLLEGRMQQQVHRRAEDAVEVLLEARPRQRSIVRVSIGFNYRCLLRQLIVQCIAGAVANRLHAHRDQPNLRGRFIEASAANQDRSIDERQLVVLLQKDHQSIGQFDPLRLLRLKVMERRDRNLLPRLRLRRGLRGALRR